MKNGDKGLGSKFKDSDEHWISVSDVMAGLMMVFLFLAIVYMLKVEKEKKSMKVLSKIIRELKTIYTMSLTKNLKMILINGTRF